ncbi:GPI inositol-deacylase [Aricia agestis]|uniref:GPI inositol-deacylase n=1 Tax=Aricia agestis TaxID=91739 RepID=UPI001C20237E|nr:GPI inositol-deacylase [Aricia agestis]
MKLFNFISSSIFQIISLVFVIGYLLGALNIYFSDKNNYCAMTYMFEYPQFVHISLEANKIFPQYGLYAYSEGRFTERARKMWFDGIPVLFIPGNSGSHMQARSIASVALRKALSRDYGYHFDFFTISYNEELSGLYGGVLQYQTQFAAACLTKILSLYKSNRYTKTVPTSVIVIGHSMGGLIAKRLLAYPRTVNITNIAITLAAPLLAPVVNFDMIMNDYYMRMDREWDALRSDPALYEKKVLISIGSGPRDVLMPAGMTASNDSYINTLATSIPGVWVTPDHVSMVWCKQLVMVINKFLFGLVDVTTNQITESVDRVKTKARQYFQANRSMLLHVESPNTVSMVMDAFWYEDNRRVYQISRPDIDRMTYLMIRLVKFPQNRFVAVESVNLDDKDWIFGCNANQVHNTYRYCKEATSLTQLSRWSGAATEFGKRKLATVHLHHIMARRPDWTHVVVKVSPTNKPIILNVDINDHASRQINVQLPSPFSFTRNIIIERTEPNSIYYELLLDDFNLVYQAYLLYVEPSGNCQATQYHVSAEMHVPWAENNENYHYFTHLKRTPMKMRLFKSNPNVTVGLDTTDKVKITLLLDPQCTFTVSISQSWYHSLAQMARNYTPLLVPYIAAIVLLAARSSLLYLKEHGSCLSIHGALTSDGVKPYYILVFGRLGSTLLFSIPVLAIFLENASWSNLELQYFTRSLLVLPVYMTGLGILNIAAAAVLVLMVFSSQIAHRVLFRIVWRGGGASNPLAEKITAGLQRAPAVVSCGLLCGATLACGAAALVAGAAFYAFMLSKMYEEYLEDYVYKLMAKIGTRICRIFKSKPKEKELKTDLKAIENKKDEDGKEETSTKGDEKEKEISKTDSANNLEAIENKNVKEEMEKDDKDKEIEVTNNKCNNENEIDEDLNNLNFHMMLFFLWMCVTIVNIPALLTWARNFKYSIALKPDTSYYTGLVMSACSCIIWQQNGPKKEAKYNDAVCSLIFAMAVIIIALGPFSLSIMNYGITYIFAVITIQQVCTEEEPEKFAQENDPKEDEIPPEKENVEKDETEENKSDNPAEEKEGENTNSENTSDCNVCSESRIYSMFRNLREKLSFGENE